MNRLKKSFILMTLVVMAMQFFVGRLSASAYNTGDVVINEISWAGSVDNSVDEWIELYNTTNQSIDLTGWYVEDDGASVYLIESGIIDPHGYFLMEDSEDTVSNVSADAVIGLSLANAGDSLVLKDNTDIVIDTVNSSGGAWYAGDSTSKATMERIDPNETLDTADNWASALSSNGAVGSGGSEILGTPKGANSNYGGSGPSVSFSPADVSATPGEQVTVSVDVDSTTDLYAYGFEINYDPSVLNYVSAVEGDFLKVDGVSTAFNSALEDGNEGTLIVGNARLLNPPAGVDGSGTLFDITFDIVGSDGSNSGLMFGGSSFLSDSIGDIPASYDNGNVSVTSGTTVSEVTNLQVSQGTERYSLELTWEDINTADSYIVIRQEVDESFISLGEVTEMSFTDNLDLVPQVTYNYQVIAVKDGNQSAPVSASGAETRGLIGDLDRSDRVDGRDIELLARAYGSEFIDEEYTALYDTNYDGIIDGSDLIDIGANFGLTY
ncbi:hypothetical protein GF366_02485 [Candidatus Peregrinibacteria bacterium]|nr:hypothetical protein [Candidatus Peregrinibacteria bacterium]